MNVVPPKSHSACPPEGEQARKDSAAYVSLSSYSLVKQHDDGSSFGPAFADPARDVRPSPRRSAVPRTASRKRGGNPVPLGTASRVVAYIGAPFAGCQHWRQKKLRRQIRNVSPAAMNRSDTVLAGSIWDCQAGLISAKNDRDTGLRLVRTRIRLASLGDRWRAGPPAGHRCGGRSASLCGSAPIGETGET